MSPQGVEVGALVASSRTRLATRVASPSRPPSIEWRIVPVWRGWDEIEFEQHIRHLTRLQLKEYIRIRQDQKLKGERPEDEAANQATAVQGTESIPTDGQPRVCDFVAPPKAATLDQLHGGGDKKSKTKNKKKRGRPTGSKTKGQDVQGSKGPSTWRAQHSLWPAATTLAADRHILAVTSWRCHYRRWPLLPGLP
ncbi:hypothetical protein GE09DRAFT_1212362 [Coniochaeta sp. 2T2.1]|nr:hypothetical protein GE09DRAFT_1212362 [Coniochaeta sp. 2T2.1]